MSVFGLEVGQVATASGYIYMYHAKYGISAIEKVNLEPYLAIIKLRPIDPSTVSANGLRRLDFSEFERMGFGIDDQGTLSDDQLSDDPEFVPRSPERKISRKRLRAPDLSSPISEKKPRQSGRNTKYACTECDEEFTNFKAMKSHAIMYNHIGNEKPYRCEICGKTFRWKDHAGLHNRLYHRPEQKEEISSPTKWVERIHETTMQLPLFQISPIRSFEEVATIMAFEADNMAINDDKVCNTVPQYCPGPSATYLVDLTQLDHPDDISRDSYGIWGKASGENIFYSINFDSKSLTKLNKQEKGGRRKLGPNDKVDLKVRRRAFKHPQEKNFKKSIFVGSFADVPKWAIVTYEWLCTPYEFVNKAHGKRKYNKDQPYQPTAKSVMLALAKREHMTPRQNIESVAEQGKAVGPAFVPRNELQVRNQKFRKRISGKE